MSDYRRWREGQPEKEEGVGDDQESSSTPITRRYKRSNPVENLSAYIMVMGGVQRQDRLIDLDWLRDVVAAARRVTVASEAELGKAISDLREVFKHE